MAILQASGEYVGRFFTTSGCIYVCMTISPWNAAALCNTIHTKNARREDRDFSGKIRKCHYENNYF